MSPGSRRVAPGAADSAPTHDGPRAGTRSRPVSPSGFAPAPHSIPDVMPKGLLLSAAILAGAVLVSAEQRPPAGDRETSANNGQGGPGQPTFSVAVDYVEVDAGVTDAQGHPVRELRKEDFEIVEDGRRQQVETLSFVDQPLVPNSQPSTRSRRQCRRRRADQRRAVRRTDLRPPARRSAHGVCPHPDRAHGGTRVRGTDAAPRRSRSGGARLRAKGCEPGLHERPPPAACVHRSLRRPQDTLGHAERDRRVQPFGVVRARAREGRRPGRVGARQQR